MTFRPATILSISLLALSPGIAGAQDDGVTVTRLQGGVLVNQGQDFTPVDLRDALNPSDIILTRADASIGLVFGDGSSIVLPGNIQASVGDVRACLAQAPSNQPVTLRGISGSVFVMPIDGAGELLPATEGQILTPGQRVVAGQDGSVAVSYPAGCRITLGAEEFLDHRLAQECCLPGGTWTSSTAALGADAVTVPDSGTAANETTGMLSGGLLAAPIVSNAGGNPVDAAPGFSPRAGLGPNNNPGRGPNNNPGLGPNNNPGLGPNNNPGRGPCPSDGSGPCPDPVSPE